jgi:hypothetical protein
MPSSDTGPLATVSRWADLLTAAKLEAILVHFAALAIVPMLLHYLRGFFHESNHGLLESASLTFVFADLVLISVFIGGVSLNTWLGKPPASRRIPTPRKPRGP